MCWPSHSSWWAWKPYGILKMNISNMLCDLYDIKNMAKLNGFGNLPKDNEGTELTINDCIDSCIEELEEELNEWLLQKLKETNLNYLFKN